MNFKIFFFLLFSIPFISNAQKFYVNMEDTWSKGSTTESIKKLGYVVTDNKPEADIIIDMVYTKKHAALSTKFSAAKTGHIEFRNQDDSLIATTKEHGGTANAFRGYNVEWAVVKKILGDDFDTETKEAIKRLPESKQQ
jgi:hypothetical protein